MNTLHELVFQTLHNPQMAQAIATDSQAILQQFNISAVEMDALRHVLHNNLDTLMASDSFHNALQGLVMKQWPPCC